MWRPSSCLATTFTILTAFCLGFLPAVHAHSADFSSPPTLLLNLKTLNEFNVLCIIDSNFNFNASSSSCLWTPAIGLWHLLSPTPTFLQLQMQMDGTRNPFSLQTVPPKWARTTHPSMVCFHSSCILNFFLLCIYLVLPPVLLSWTSFLYAPSLSIIFLTCL